MKNFIPSILPAIINLDNVVPTVAITLSDYAFKIGDTATVTFTFSEQVLNFTSADVTTPNGSLSSFGITGNPLIYTATFTPTNGVEDATNVITVGTNWTDLVGNPPSGSTNSSNYTVDTLAPTLPTGLSATPISTSQINLAWTDASSDESGFRVYRSTDGNTYSQLGVDLASGTQAYNDTTVTSGTKYYYKVGVFDASNNEGLTDAVAANTLTLTLISYWKLDEASTGSASVQRNDSVGTNHLADTNTTASGTGKVSNGADFEFANSEYLSIASNATLQTGDIDFTICAWVKPEDTRTAGIVSKWSSAPNLEYAVWLNSTKYSLAVSSNGTAVNFQDGSVTAVGGTWAFVVAWHDSVANTLNIQVNGGTVSSSSYSSGVASKSSLFSIGSFAGTSDFDGVVDEVGFWKRVLTASERTALYNGGSGNTYPFESAGSPVASAETIDLTISGQAARYLVPASHNGILVMYHHGANEDQYAWTSDIRKAGLTSALLNGGYILAASNAHGNNWGSATSVADYNALYADAAGRFSLSKVIFVSQSMGGLSGLNCIQDGTIPVDGWVGIYPACNLRWCYDNGFSADIKTSFGIAGNGSDYDTKTAGLDPVLLDGTSFTMPMRFYASPGDIVINKASNTDTMDTLVSPYASEDDVVVCSGDHGDASHFQPSDVISFIGRC